MTTNDVAYLARKYAFGTDPVDYDDLFQEGMLVYLDGGSFDRVKAAMRKWLCDNQHPVRLPIHAYWQQKDDLPRREDVRWIDEEQETARSDHLEVNNDPDIDAIISDLTPRQEIIVRMLYGLAPDQINWPSEQVAEMLRISDVTVRYHKGKAFARLRRDERLVRKVGTAV